MRATFLEGRISSHMLLRKDLCSIVIIARVHLVATVTENIVSMR